MAHPLASGRNRCSGAGLRAVGGCGAAARPIARRSGWWSPTTARLAQPAAADSRPAARHGHRRRRHHPPRRRRAAAGSVAGRLTESATNAGTRRLAPRPARPPVTDHAVDAHRHRRLGRRRPGLGSGASGRVLGGRPDTRRRLDDVPEHLSRRRGSGAAARYRPTRGRCSSRSRAPPSYRPRQATPTTSCCWRRAPGCLSWRRTAGRSPACGSACCLDGPNPGRIRSPRGPTAGWRRRSGLHEPVLHLGERLKLAEIEENATAGVALLQVDAVALVCLHDARALGAQQGVAHVGRG